MKIHSFSFTEQIYARYKLAKRDEYEKKTEALIQPILDAHQFELVDIEYVKEGGTMILRAYIDKPGGILIDDCELVSRALSDKLDEADFIEDDAYTLEVSSPGLLRPFKKDKDFLRNIGSPVEVKLFKAVDGEKEFIGTLTAYEDEKATVDVEGKLLILERKNISLMRQSIDFSELF